MKELIEVVVKGFLGYLPKLISVTTTPKPSILTLITNEPDKLNKALTFCFISIAIGISSVYFRLQSETGIFVRNTRDFYRKLLFPCEKHSTGTLSSLFVTIASHI